MTTRGQAKAQGLSLYSTGKPCVHGHTSDRYTRNGGCRECERVCRAFRDRPKRIATPQSLSKAAERNRRYRVRHAERLRAKAKGRDRSVELANKKRPESRAADRKYMAAWREENREKVREYHRKYQPEWRERHPHKAADIAARRRMRLRAGLVEDVSRIEIFERDGYRCQICGSKLNARQRYPHPKAPTVDHIIPVSKGGRHERSNLQCACWHCNKRKGNRAADDQLLLIG